MLKTKYSKNGNQFCGESRSFYESSQSIRIAVTSTDVCRNTKQALNFPFGLTQLKDVKIWRKINSFCHKLVNFL